MYSSALQFRRWAIILAALFSGLLVFISMLVDPVPDASGKELIQGYADNPLLQGIHTNLIHYGFALFAPVAFGIVGLVRGRGAWVANFAGLFAVLGLTTLPGLVVVDYHSVAMAHTAGVDVAAGADEAVGNLPGFLLIVMPAMLGAALSLPLATIAAWRARLVHWWVPVAVVAAEVAMPMVPARIGFGLLALATAGVAYALWSIPAYRWFGAPEAEAVARETVATAEQADLRAPTVVAAPALS